MSLSFLLQLNTVNVCIFVFTLLSTASTFRSLPGGIHGVAGHSPFSIGGRSNLRQQHAAVSLPVTSVHNEQPPLSIAIHQQAHHAHNGVRNGEISAELPPLTNYQTQPLEIVYQWNIMDFSYPSRQLRNDAIINGDFIPENNLPLGVARWRDRLFVTMPRWKPGVPFSLGWLPLPARNPSQPIAPYPSWQAHTKPDTPNCDRLMSVYRMVIDECNRMWVIDAGVVNATILLNQLCPPKIVVYDLITDRQLLTYVLPPDQVKQDSLYTNIVVDIENEQCDRAYAYVTDVWRYGLTVFSLAHRRSWRTTHHLYLPTPFAADYNLHGLNFQWTDGIFGLSLTNVDRINGDRYLLYHPMSSFTEFMVSTSILKNESLWLMGFPSSETAAAFIPLGERGVGGQSSTCGIDRNGVMFFTLVTQDAIACWDTRKSYRPINLGIIEQNATTLVFPNDLKLDHELEQNVWVLSNRLPAYLYAQLDYTDINFRIQRASVQSSVAGTICDPLVRGPID